MANFLFQSPHVIYASSGSKNKQEKSFRTDFNALWNAVINSFFHQEFRTTLMMTCEKKSILIAVTLQSWNYGPHKSWEELFALLPSETERGGRDYEIQVGSSQDNVVESFTKCAHILLCKELDNQNCPVPLLTKICFGLVPGIILEWIKTLLIWV